MISRLPFLFAPLLLVAACSSSGGSTDDSASESPTNPDGTNGSSTSSCTCTVKINGAEKNLTCGEETCLGGSTYRCVDGRGVERGGTCSTSKAPAKTGAPDSSQTPAPKPSTNTCAPPSCATDMDCKAYSASWRCFDLGALGDRKGCFNSEPPFGASGGTCTDGSSTAIHTQCEDGKIAVCVPSTCKTTEQKPHAAQRRKCY